MPKFLLFTGTEEGDVISGLMVLLVNITNNQAEADPDTGSNCNIYAYNVCLYLPRLKQNCKKYEISRDPIEIIRKKCYAAIQQKCKCLFFLKSAK